jgi:6-pyruvoyltetrahydropterin/6-carboxytetrahydropterin synthase
MITAHRYHDFSYGHRVVGHESKCRWFHGHNGRVHFTITAPALDKLGRVMDFSVIKARLCVWLEDNWDHKFLMSWEDPFYETMSLLDPSSIVRVPFNPTAENMARHLVEVIGPQQLEGTECVLISCTVDETRKCSATFALPAPYMGNY